jgi:hypothetical protein
MKDYFNKIYFLLYSVLNVLYLNIIFFYKKKFLKKNIIFFYHPNPELTKIHSYYIEDIFSKLKGFETFYGTKIIFSNKNYFFIKSLLVKCIYGVDIFISNNICDYFTNSSTRVYIHHDIYDTPLVKNSKIKQLSARLYKYDHIFLPSKKFFKLFDNIFKKNIKKPKLHEIGYMKLNYFIKIIKIKKNKSINQIILAPTNFDAFPRYSLQKYIFDILDILLKNNISVIYRPHPSNREHYKILDIISHFKKNKLFKYDKSENYIREYLSSSIMITDISGTAYTYAFLTENPVIFFSPNDSSLVKDKYAELNYIKDRSKIGVVLKDLNTLISIIKIIKLKKMSYKNNILKLKSHFLNFKNSSTVLQNKFKTIIDDAVN